MAGGRIQLRAMSGVAEVEAEQLICEKPLERSITRLYLAWTRQSRKCWVQDAMQGGDAGSSRFVRDISGFEGEQWTAKRRSFGNSSPTT